MIRRHVVPGCCRLIRLLSVQIHRPFVLLPAELSLREYSLPSDSLYKICVLSSKESIDQANQVRRDMFMKAQGICVRSSLAQMERVYYDQVDNFSKAFNSLNEHLRRQSHVFLRGGNLDPVSWIQLDPVRFIRIRFRLSLVEINRIRSG